ncbi:MAG: TlpA disulfide reductase family protein [Bacteroidales bacterium]
MRKFFLFFALTGLFACGPQTQESDVHFSGTLENPPDAAVELDFFRDYINNDRKVVALEPDREGDFSVSFAVPEPVLGTLSAGRASMPVYLESDFDLRLQGDASRLPRDVGFSGNGSTENNFLVAYFGDVESDITRSLLHGQAEALSPSEYLVFADSLEAAKREYLNGYPEKDALSEAFLRFFDTRVTYEKYQQLLDYPSLHQRLNELADIPELPDHYYDFLDDAADFDGERLNNLTYVNFLLNYMDYKREADDLEFDPAMSAHEVNYELADDYLSGRSQYYIQALSVSRELHSGDLDAAMEMYDHYLANSPAEDYKARLEGAYETVQSLWAGNPAPDFTMTDIDGNTFSLSDYRGKVVYLKFWASWCPPCMRQVPHAAELKERMAGEDDLVFMYVSIDVNPEAWRNTVESHGISGVHARTPGRERGVPALYNVRWIPTFYIIGRDGNIFDHRPPVPADEDVDEVLREALHEEA